MTREFFSTLLVPKSLVASFQMVDHDLDWRDLDTVEELGDAPLSEREVIGEYLNAGADQQPKLWNLRRRPGREHRILN